MKAKTRNRSRQAHTAIMIFRFMKVYPLRFSLRLDAPGGGKVPDYSDFVEKTEPAKSTRREERDTGVVVYSNKF